MNNKLQASTLNNPSEETNSQEKEVVIDDILQLYEKLLAHNNHIEQQRSENDYLRQENQIYIDYIANLEGRIDNITNKP